MIRLEPGDRVVGAVGRRPQKPSWSSLLDAQLLRAAAAVRAQEPLGGGMAGISSASALESSTSGR